MPTGVAILLHQRGRLVLHASAAVVAGQAVAFVGESGYGKSTLALALTPPGEVLTDDVLPIRIDTDGVWAEPSGFPPRLPAAGGAGKRRVPISPATPARLRALYVLQWGEEIRTEGIPPGERIATVLVSMFCRRMLAIGGRTEHLEQCGVIARQSQTRRLLRPRGLEHLEATRRAIERDLATMTS